MSHHQFLTISLVIDSDIESLSIKLEQVIIRYQRSALIIKADPAAFRERMQPNIIAYLPLDN